MTKKTFSFGPATLVTAAFIGPGTITAASKAGAHFGYALLWALVFSVIATIILQEMTARLAVVGQTGLGETIRKQFKHPIKKAFAIILVVSAIIIGNAAYEGGNISGASLGLKALFNDMTTESGFDPFALMIGIAAFLLLWTGSYTFIEKAIILLVLLMSLSFLVTFIISSPNMGQLFKGMFIPSLPSGSTLTVIALIGTTVVPYNLFLHASSVSKKWQKPEQLKEARQDLYLSIPVGGLISIAIVSTATVAFFDRQLSLNNAADLALSLEPLFGVSAKYFMAVGLFAAGISSAITAPLASAYALSGLLNLSPSMKSFSFRFIWIGILVSGVIISSLGFKPINVIWFAQIANGILLPIIALFLLWIMNQKFLGEYRNNLMQNILGAAVILVTLLLSARSLSAAFNLI